MPSFPWWSWMVLAGVVGLAEMHLPGGYLIWIALGAAVTGVIDGLFDLSLTNQLIMFGVASAVSCGGGYFVYRGFGRRRGEYALNERNQAMLGARGTVCEAFRHGHGKVRVGDGVWLAAGPDLAEGAAVVVTAVRGTRLHVQALSPLPHAASPPSAAE